MSGIHHESVAQTILSLAIYFFLNEIENVLLITHTDLELLEWTQTYQQPSAWSKVQRQPHSLSKIYHFFCCQFEGWLKKEMKLWDQLVLSAETEEHEGEDREAEEETHLNFFLLQPLIQNYYSIIRQNVKM